jgi:hypothetical protein
MKERRRSQKVHRGEPMKKVESRRDFLKTAAVAAGAILLPKHGFGQTETTKQHAEVSMAQAASGTADYTLRINTSPVEIAKDRILSLTTYNG